MEIRLFFEGFTQTFKKGGKYAITGCSGSGKSTLLNIFLGILKITREKSCLENWSQKRLMRTQSCLNVPMLGSNSYLINDTLRNNLTLWNEAITDTQIKKVLERVNLLSFLNRIDEQVSDGSFSEGQKQRIGLIRAFLKGCSVVIFDELLQILTIIMLLVLSTYY